MFRRFALVAACGAISLLALGLRAEDPKPAAPSADDQAAMMKAWEEFAKPGDEHKRFTEMVGEWDVAIEDYTSGQTTQSKGEGKFSLIMDGRYLMQEFTGSMGGMEFKGMGLTGYNNQTKKFQEIWLDNMGTAIFFSEGTRLDDKTTESKGMMTMPGMGEIQSRNVSKAIDKDHFEFTMYMTMNGQEMKAIKMDYTRKP